MAMIKVIDNFLIPDQRDFVIEYCETASYHYGEYDREGLPFTGMVSEIDETKDIYELFRYKTEHLVPGLELDRMYVNCFAPSENPYFHTDGEDGITFLYYPEQGWALDDGGETQFYIDGEIRGIVPEPNRMVYFDANILHRATTFRDRHRFSVAIKYMP
jgi:hypothetical protein